ncbi:MAG: RNA polymerase-binding protein DksA [Deltaproteobacteria bacterium]|nr:RNA polymerase-binding protein DksA [Deltaproteobacteria bacterium]MCK5709266.1 RNA polymerase-binding protein DksA [Deltaproteobacteria bacterium]
MKDKKLKLFREILIKKMAGLLGIAEGTVTRMSEGDGTFPDPIDRAMSESSTSIELRKRDRERKLIGKIQKAIQKTEDGSYGICEVCEDEITEDRLIVRPETTLCIGCKEEQEIEEKQFGS